ncbi:glycosyltransferase, partial [Paracidovorax avenae]
MPSARRPRVLHFVTGGFSGATQVAADLVRAHAGSGRFDAV